MENWKEQMYKLLREFNTEGYWSYSCDQDEPIMLSDETLATSLSFFENLPDNYPHPKIYVTDDGDEDGSYVVCKWENKALWCCLVITATHLDGLLKDADINRTFQEVKETPYAGGPIPDEVLKMIPSTTEWKPTIFDQINK